MTIKAELTSRDKKYLQTSLYGSVWKAVLHIGTPLAHYQALNQLFVILDTMMAAHISKESVSAVAYLSQIQMILSSVGGGLAVGAGILISMAYGAGDLVMVRRRVSTLYIICLAAGLTITVAILPFTESFLRLTGTPETLIEVGTQYFAVELLVMVVTFLNNVYIAVERARGNARRIFALNMLAIVTKLRLTAWFVYGMEGSLVMIGLASLIAQLLMLVFAVVNSVRGEGAFCFSPRAVSFRREVIGPMIGRSLPVIAEKALFSFGKAVVNGMCSVYGELMVGALGVSNQLGGITTNPQNGYQEGAAALISQNIGARKPQRALKVFYATIVINVVLGAVISAVELWRLDFFAGLFDSGSLEFRGMIETLYRYEAWGAVPLGVNAAVLALLYGLGETKWTMALNVARVFVFRIPVLWFLERFTQVGPASPGVVMLISNTASGLMAVAVAWIVAARRRRESRFRAEAATETAA